MKSDLIYKAFSVMIAIALVIYVNGERNPHETRQFRVPLQVINQEPGTIIQSIPANITVQVRGPRNGLNQVDQRDLKAQVNLSGVKAGQQEVRVLVTPQEGVELPADVTWEVRNPTVKVELQQVSNVSRTLEPVFLRPAPAGYSYGTPSFRPSVAYISGPRDAVSRVAGLEVVVDATPTPDKPISGQFDIRAVDAAGREVQGVKLNPASARVTVALQRAAAEKEVLISPNITGGPPPTMRITSVEVAPRSVVVSGNPQTLENVNFISTQEIDLENVTTSSVVRSVPMKVPEGVTVQGPNRVRVEIDLTPIAPEGPARE